MLQPLNFNQIVSKLTRKGFTITTGQTDENKAAPLIYLDNMKLGWLEDHDGKWDIITTSEAAFTILNETLTGVTLWPWYGEFREIAHGAYSIT